MATVRMVLVLALLILASTQPARAEECLGIKILKGAEYVFEVSPSATRLRDWHSTDRTTFIVYAVVPTRTGAIRTREYEMRTCAGVLEFQEVMHEYGFPLFERDRHAVTAARGSSSSLTSALGPVLEQVREKTFSSVSEELSEEDLWRMLIVLLLEHGPEIAAVIKVIM